MTTDATRSVFRAWVRTLFAPLAKDLEQPSDGRNEFARRDALAKVLMVVGDIGQDADILSRARGAVLEGDPTGAPAADPDLSDAFTKLAASNGGASVFERIVARIEHAASPGVAERNVEALGYFSDPALVERALDHALSAPVDPHLKARVIGSALRRQAARAAAWRFVKSHWKEIATTIGPTDAVQAVLDAADTFCDATLRDDLKAFFGARGLGGEVNARLEAVQSCIDFQSAQRGNFTRWIAKVEGRR